MLLVLILGVTLLNIGSARQVLFASYTPLFKKGT